MKGEWCFKHQGQHVVLLTWPSAWYWSYCGEAAPSHFLHALQGCCLLPHRQDYHDPLTGCTTGLPSSALCNIARGLPAGPSDTGHGVSWRFPVWTGYPSPLNSICRTPRGDSILGCPWIGGANLAQEICVALHQLAVLVLQLGVALLCRLCLPCKR